QPGVPAGCAPETDVEGELGHRRVAADGGHRPVVDVAERRRATAGNQTADLAAGMVALLEGDRRHLEVQLAVPVPGTGDVADHEDLGMIAKTEVAVDGDPAAGAERQPGGRRERR